jgi:hypothetical protein
MLQGLPAEKNVLMNWRKQFQICLWDMANFWRWQAM